MDASADNKAVVLLSGGVDSTTLLALLLHDGYAVYPVSVHYGQRHARELGSARALVRHYGLEASYKPVNLSPLQAVMAGSSQTSTEVPVPQGHYASESMKQTVVPNRNMVLLAVAGAYAASVGASAIAYAAHAGDHPIYPDCRPAFVDAMRGALALCHDTPLLLLAPFNDWSKADIVRRGLALGVPYDKTWSCYEGGEVHCGKCGTCCERAEAFYRVGTADPVPYLDDTYWRKATDVHPE